MERKSEIWLRTLIWCHFWAMLLFAQHLFAGHGTSKIREDEYAQGDYARLFHTNDILNLTILSDFSSIMNDRDEDRSYHKGLVYYIAADSDTIFRKVRLKTRGNFRRDPANCRYPPIMVKFDQQKMTDPVFTGQSKLKLVTQCQLENYILLEYTAYRIYNILTEKSFRVRLAHITYADLKTKEAYFTRYAFFIESVDELEKRLNMKKYKRKVVQYFLEREHAITMSTFQYLIGNIDWYVTSAHNVTILQDEVTDSLYSVPYDFDWSKFVDAEYTKPANVPEYRLTERRVYKGLCMRKEDFLKQQEIFNAKYDEIISLIRKMEHIPKSRKHAAIKYIEKFYKTLNNPASLEKVFRGEKCISKPESN